MTPRPTLAALLMAAAAAATPAVALDWTVAPYVWGVHTSLDLDVNEHPVVSADASFRDMVDKTQFGIMGYVEGRGAKSGFFLDGFYANLGSERSSRPRPPLPGGTEFESDLRVTMLDGVWFFRPGGRERGLDVLFGVRMADVDDEIEVRFPGPVGSTTTLGAAKTTFDAIAGLRWTGAIGGKWEFAARGDAGAGDSDLTWCASAHFGYRFGARENMSFRLGWKHLEVDKSKQGRGQDIDQTLTLDGPLVGLVIHL